MRFSIIAKTSSGLIVQPVPPLETTGENDLSIHPTVRKSVEIIPAGEDVVGKVEGNVYVEAYPFMEKSAKKWNWRAQKVTGEDM